MNTAHNTTTKRYARTLEEAFGPHTSRQITDLSRQRMHPHDRAVLWASAVAGVSAITMAVVAWI